MKYCHCDQYIFTAANKHAKNCYQPTWTLFYPTKFPSAQGKQIWFLSFLHYQINQHDFIHSSVQQVVSTVSTNIALKLGQIQYLQLTCSTFFSM